MRVKPAPSALAALVIVSLLWMSLVTACSGPTLVVEATSVPTPTTAARPSPTSAPAPAATSSPRPADPSFTPGSSTDPGPVPSAPAGETSAVSTVAAAETATATAVPTPPPLATPTQLPPTATPPPPPTATPKPPPTPTPRVKPPPSKYKTLQDYPRPAGDDGYGFHLNASPLLPSKQVLQTQVIPALKSLGATWVTVWVSTGDLPDQVEGVKLLVDSGFEVILRLHEVSPPHPNWLPPINWLERYRAVGVHYFVCGNEPNLNLENPSKAGPEYIARQWMQASDRIKSVGGIPLLYPMSPGGDRDVADARVMLVGILDWLKANDALDTLDGAAVAIHNRPHGKPLDVRDSTSFLEYEWIDDTVASYAGKHIPLLGTEAGYAFTEQVLPQYPRIDGELHKQYNMAIITGFRDGRWRDTLFTQTFWLLGGFGHDAFISDWWLGNKLNYGKDLPIVEALRALPPFTRKFSAPGFQTRPRP